MNRTLIFHIHEDNNIADQPDRVCDNNGRVHEPVNYADQHPDMQNPVCRSGEKGVEAAAPDKQQAVDKENRHLLLRN